MVGYGTQLLKARRPGWEMAYLDYNELKLLLDELDKVIFKFCSMAEDDLMCSEKSSLLDYSHQHNSLHSSSHIETYQEELSSKAEQFLYLLRKEVEKVSLYSILRQGELADAIGSLRFNFDEKKEGDVELGRKLTLRYYSEKESFFEAVTDEDSGEKVLSSAAEATLFHDLSALLPNLGSSSPSHESIRFKDATNLNIESRLMFAGSGVFNPIEHNSITNSNLATNPSVDESDNCWIPITEDGSEDSYKVTEPDHTDDYTIVAVEVLHLLRYICINAMVRA